MNNLEKAKLNLKDENTLVLVKGEIIYVSQGHGVRPMLDFINNKIDLTGFSVADKVVGKGAAMLFIYAKISEVYARLISKPALAVLNEHKVKVTYDKLVNNIINKRGDDLCPMEKATLNIDDILEAYKVLCEKNNVRPLN